jgi:hypothetical protein
MFGINNLQVLKNLKSHRKTKVMIHLTSAAVGSISYPSSEKMVMSKSILSKGGGGEPISFHIYITLFSF